MINLFSCKSAGELSTVTNVELERYSGKWYEIARLPNRFEKGMECITATYTLKDNGKVEVLNQGYSVKNKGKLNSAKGKAWVPDAKHQGRLKVSFFWPFSGDYYIIELGENYEYALVGAPSRKYLWILSRTKEIDDSLYLELLEKARTKGFDITSIIKVHQNCNDSF